MLLNGSDRPSKSTGQSAGVHLLSAQQVGEKLHLDATAVEWIENEFSNENTQLCVLKFQEAFFHIQNGLSIEQKKLAVHEALELNGGIRISENVYKFVDWGVFEARQQMQSTMLWCFYSTNSFIAGKLGISQVPTITTAIVVPFSDEESHGYMIHGDQLFNM